MSQQSALPPEVAALRDREATFTAPDPVGAAAIRQFALALGDTNPHYVDQEFARKSKYGGIVAPPTMVCETMYYHDGRVDETGGPASRFLLPIGQEIRASNDYTFYQLLRPEDILTAHWKTINIYEKTGRTGRLFFLEYEIRYTNQRGELLAINHEQLVFRVPHSQEKGVQP